MTGPAVRRRRRPGRPRADHAQGGEVDRRSRRRRLPLRHGRSLDRPDHRRRADPRRDDRGVVDLPRHDRDDRPSAGLLRRGRGLLRRVAPNGWRSTWTPAGPSSCSPRAIRSSTARTCISMTGWPTAIRARLVPGVTSISAAAAAIATPLARHEDILTVLPGTLPVPELARRLADTDAAAIMKLGRTFAGVREALRQAGRLDDATYVERASTGEQRTLPVAEVDPAEVPYFSMIIVPGRDRRLDSAGRAAADRTEEAPARRARELFVVGLGPGPDRWLTPEVGRGPGRGRSCRRLRPLRRPGAAARRAAAARVGQHRRDRSGPARARSRPRR